VSADEHGDKEARWIARLARHRRAREHAEHLLEHRSSELYQANQRLDEARARAEQQSHAKSRFLANMSHELRTPLNTIIGYADLIAEDAHDVPVEQTVEDINKIRDAADHLLGLINDILDISKIEAGKMSVHPEWFLFDELVEQARQAAVTLVAGPKVIFKLDHRAPGLNMCSDRVRLKQVLLNLISNAAKFTTAGHVKLSTSLEGGELIIAVEDTGIGISPGDLEHIFDAFEQTRSDTWRHELGTGLGLSLSRRFSELLGGELTVTSERGVGSTFTLAVPVAPLEPDPSLVLNASSSEYSLADDIEQRRPRLSLIDDDEVSIDIVSRVLSDVALDLEIERHTGQYATLSPRALPDLIILDVDAGGGAGWALLEALRLDAPMTPIIVLTANEDRSRAYRLGATQYTSKPLDRAALFGLLDTYLPKLERG